MRLIKLFSIVLSMNLPAFELSDTYNIPSYIVFFIVDTTTN